MPRRGLDAAAVTLAAAEMADEVGLSGLSMTALAERLDIRPPSLYKHVSGLDDLIHRVGTLAVIEMAEAFDLATRDRVGRDALVAIAHTFRSYVKQHPGRYAATAGMQPRGDDDPLSFVLEETVDALHSVVKEYHLSPANEIHAIRMLRSLLQGFATVEVTGGFMAPADLDETFEWIVRFVDSGFRGIGGSGAAHPQDNAKSQD